MKKSLIVIILVFLMVMLFQSVPVAGIDSSLIEEGQPFKGGDFLLYTPSRQSVYNGSVISSNVLWLYGSYWGEENLTVVLEYGKNPERVNGTWSYSRVFSRNFTILLLRRVGRPFYRFAQDIPLDTDPSRPSYHLNLTISNVRLFLEYRMDILQIMFESNVAFISGFFFQIAGVLLISVILSFAFSKYIMRRVLFFLDFQSLILTIISLTLGGVPAFLIQLWSASVSNTKEEFFMWLMVSYAVFVFLTSMIWFMHYLSVENLRLFPQVHLGKKSVKLRFKEYARHANGKYVYISNSILYFFNRLFRSRYRYLDEELIDASFDVHEQEETFEDLPKVEKILFMDETMEQPERVIRLAGKRVVMRRMGGIEHISDTLEDFVVFNRYMSERLMEVSTVQTTDTIMHMQQSRSRSEAYKKAIDFCRKKMFDRVAQIRRQIRQKVEEMEPANLMEIFDRESGGPSGEKSSNSNGSLGTTS